MTSTNEQLISFEVFMEMPKLEIIQSIDFPKDWGPSCSMQTSKWLIYVAVYQGNEKLEPASSQLSAAIAKEFKKKKILTK